MDVLPKELITWIISLLNDKDARAARLVNTDWFRWVNYSRFTIYFASTALLPQIAERLSKYQHPIELDFRTPVKYSKSDFLEHISRLTHLKSLEFWDFSENSQEVIDPSKFFKLTTLTNLEVLNLFFGDDRYLPVELLQYLPRLKRSDNFEPTPEFFKLATLFSDLYCKDTDLPMITIAVTELRVSLTDQPLDELARLTRLKKLELNDTTRPLDLRHITWLESLNVDTADVIGLENSVHLTELVALSIRKENDVLRLLDTMAQLPLLEKVMFNFLDDVNLSLPNLSRVTSLVIFAGKKVDPLLYDSLSTSLIDLYISPGKESSVELGDLLHLVHLTTLHVESGMTTAVKPLSTLTNLIDLTLRLKSQQPISVQSLTNLTSLQLSRGCTKELSISALTNLLYLEMNFSQIDTETWESLQYLTQLTSLECDYSTFSGSEQAMFSFSVLARLPLRVLGQLDFNEGFWTTVPLLTDLEVLTISNGVITEEDQLLLLTGLTRLTKLRIHRPANDVQLIHLTKLTSLQDLAFLYKPISEDLAPSKLSMKLTRLIHNYV